VYFETINEFALINPTPYHNIYVYMYIYANEYAHVLLLLTSAVTAYVFRTHESMLSSWVENTAVCACMLVSPKHTLNIHGD